MPLERDKDKGKGKGRSKNRGRVHDLPRANFRRIRPLIVGERFIPNELKAAVQ